MNEPLPIDVVGGDDGTLDADAAQVGRAIGQKKRRDATEAGPDSARHLVLEGYVARNVMFRDQPGQSGEHGRRTAADDLGGSLAVLQPAGQKLGNQTVVTGRAIVGRDLDLNAGAEEVMNTSKKTRPYVRRRVAWPRWRAART